MAWDWIKKYLWSIVSAILIICLFFILPRLILGNFNPVIVAIGGLWFAVPVQIFLHSYMSPVLQIKNKPETTTFDTVSCAWQEDNNLHISHYCVINRIIIKNTGRTAAKNCKGYIVQKNRNERVGWTISAERPNATINSDDEEKLDFCAFIEISKSKIIKPEDKLETMSKLALVAEGRPPKLFAPTENGWERYKGVINPLYNRDLHEIKDGKVLITAENAKSVKKKIKFDYKNNKIIIRDN